MEGDYHGVPYIRVSFNDLGERLDGPTRSANGVEVQQGNGGDQKTREKEAPYAKSASLVRHERVWWAKDQIRQPIAKSEVPPSSKIVAKPLLCLLRADFRMHFRAPRLR